MRASRAAIALAAAATLGLAAAASLLYPPPAAAHALVGKQDLPIPEWLFAWGASLVLIVSFIALTLAWRNVYFESDGWRPVPARLSRAIVNPGTDVAAGAIGVFLLGVVVWSGLAGTESPDRNFSVTFVFVTFWLGLVLLSILLGDVFRAVNPWRAIAGAFAGVFRAVTRQDAPSPLAYPERLGRWPAVAGLLGFLWLELVYAQPGFGSAGLTPRTLTIAVLVYTTITLVGMALYGIESWLDRGEAFSVYFGMFSRLAPLEVREGRLGLRRPLAGATAWAAVPGSVAMVMVAIGGTAFDGAQEGLVKDPINEVFQWMLDQGFGGTLAYRLTNTLFLALAVGFVAGIFWLGVRGMRAVRGTSLSLDGLGRAFVHGFIPIALAYLAAHYFSLFVFQEQAQFSYLLTDPLGDGSNLLGISKDPIDYGLIGATAVWYVQVGALVVGHVTGLVLAHDRAIAVYDDPRLAARSQYWMLALMVGFTCLGLFLLSQANQ
jgi:hypothetical protein